MRHATTLVPPRWHANKDEPTPLGLVTCPNCCVVMARISLNGSEHGALHEAVYRCQKCETETRRWIKP